ncbi:MAG: glycine cleavage system aminomethyltransferase GcvT, partial [Algicola sp.]|nr:glycine cleavage system aminomethyltransferase GcvT [Algicola sp.]
STSPFEAGLGWIVKFTKSFTNSENLSEQKKRILERKLVAFELDEKGIPRHGYDIVDSNGKPIGKVTSGTMSPSLKKGIGLGYVSPLYSEFGSKIHIQVRKKAIPATVVKLPFYKG